MPESINPYQPPPEQTTASRLPDHRVSAERVDIDGGVTVDDIAEMNGSRKTYFAMLVLTVLFSITVAVARVDTAFFLPIRRFPVLLGILLVAVIFVLLLLAFDRFVGASSTARRLVAKHPDMIGPVLGYLDSFGLTFYSEAAAQYLQFSWAAFTDIDVTDSGIKFDWGEPNFIAVPARCIDGFEKVKLRKFIDARQTSASQPPIYQALPDWSQSPSHAIRFQNYLQMKPPASRSMIAIHWSLTILTYLIAIAVLLLVYNDAHFGIVAAAAITAMVLSQYQAKRWKRFAPDPYFVREWGWIAEQEVHACHPYSKREFRWDEVAELQINDSLLSATLSDGSLFGVTCDSPISENPKTDWSQIHQWAQKGWKAT